MMSLAWIVALFVSVYIELWYKGPASLLCSNSSTEIPCHGKASVQCVCTELQCRGLPNLLQQSLSNHFNLRTPKLDGNVRHIKASMWFQRAIVCLTWFMWDLRPDFPSYSVNLSDVNFSKGLIPRFLERMESGTSGLSPSIRRLAEILTRFISIRRSLCLFNVTDLLSVRLSRLIWDQRCLLSQPSRGGSVGSLTLSSDCPTTATWIDFANMLSAVGAYEYALSCSLSGDKTASASRHTSGCAI
ncbi:hypothetical protein Acr_01g0011000 [Actinidia rufa]|uniref:Uncharacterized protein n=1 Tax=Actinidia rufa TaxID=165716 RepID=A0A7J0E465_9ERIC|nr:hypothetical protein Acr_01g0011000 [Actinidia rufa]